MQNEEQASRATWDYSQKHLLDEFRGVKLLPDHTHDAGPLHRIEKSVRALEDLLGEKLRAPNRVANRMLAALRVLVESAPQAKRLANAGAELKSRDDRWHNYTPLQRKHSSVSNVLSCVKHANAD